MSSSEFFAMPSQPARGESQSLYRKHRPQSFAADELVGQEHIVQTLRNAIVLGRVAHAYLFCGPHGTGKTTTARLLAKAVNCLDPDPGQRPCNQCEHCVAITTGATTDVVEIDAASNRGIDDIRDLRERVKYAPTQLGTKFYIIDEAHQITGAAANAFLKTLEEPPAHTCFVLATTDPEELLQTIVSRCQRFDFRRIGLEAMVARLQTVVAAEGLTAERNALEAIARHATGSLRDALGLLDQLSVYQEERGDAGAREITLEAVRQLLGISRDDRIEALVVAIAERDAGKALAIVNDAVDAGEDARQLNRQLVNYVRALMFVRAGADRGIDGASTSLAARFKLGELAELANLFSQVDFRIRHSTYGQLPLEIALVEAITRDAAATAPDPPPVRQPAADTGYSSVGVTREEVQARPATTRLQDRVRRQPGVREDVSPAPAVAPRPGVAPPSANSPEPVRSTPPAASQAPASGEIEPLSVDRLVELWTQIKLDVKTVDRRVEALLAAADPYDVVGATIHLVTPYEFHNQRLNNEQERSIVAGVIERIFGQRVEVICHQRGQEPARSSSFATGTADAVAETPSVTAEAPIGAGSESRPDPAPPDDEARSLRRGSRPKKSGSGIDDERIKAAMTIFDAEPVDD